MTTSTLPHKTQPRFALRVLTLVALACATVVVFSPVRDAGWILFDDPAYVVRNSFIANGLTRDGLAWILQHPHGGNFHPLTSIAHMLDAEMFGASARGPHLVNLALHTANALLVCIVLWRYTGAWWRSAIVAAFFALHPLRVESVAWISERKDVLSTLFFLLTLLAYQRWTAAPSRGRYAIPFGLFLLGLLAKPMLVTLPFLLLVLDFWPLRRARWPVFGPGTIAHWREKWPLFLLTIASIVLTYLVQKSAGAVMSEQTLALGPRIANALTSYARYIGLTFAPHDLAIYYPLSNSPRVDWAALSALMIVALSALAWFIRARHPALLVGWLWYLGTLVPVIGVVQVGAQAYADRYSYIPGIGIGIAVVWVLTELTAKSRALRVIATCAAGIALILCGLATARQTALWKDTRTLFTHALSVTEPNAVSHQNLGNALLMDGEIEPAIAHLREALRIVPGFPDAENNLGTALGNKGLYEEAIAHFRSALKRENTAELHQNLGWALTQSGRGDEAIPEYQAALRIDPNFAAAHAKLGAALCARGRLDEASLHLERALDLDDGDIETHRSLAITRTFQGRVEDGIRAYRELLERWPNDLDALNNIAWIRATHADPLHRNGAEAVRLAERAEALPHDPNAVLLSTLAAAYAEVGRFDDAQRTVTRAIELAREKSDSQAAARFEIQLDHYRRTQPFHQ